MLLEVALYFILGFFVAGLLALMISPVIWNRAVTLTREKIESSVPLSVNEIQADKDQLRAEFSMSTRRLEMSIEELRAKADEQLIEISRKRDQIARYDADMKERLETISELEAKASDLRATLASRESQFEELKARQEKLEIQFAETSKELAKAKSSLNNNERELEDTKIELEAKKGKIESLTNTLVNTDIGGDDTLEKFRQFGLKLAETEEELEKQRAETRLAIEKADDYKRELDIAIAKLENRERELGNSRKSQTKDSSSLLDLNESLIREKARVVELETRLAKQTSQTRAVLDDASNENVQALLKSLNQQMEEKNQSLQSLEAERDELKARLSLVSANAGSEWADERQDTAVLKERINDMAAKVAAMTAEMEGKSSPIHDILKSEKSAAKTPKSSGSDEENISLAERIRAVQKAAGTGS